MTLAGAVQRRLELRQLGSIELARHRSGDARVEGDQPPVAEVGDHLQALGADTGLVQHVRLVVVAGQPARRRVEGRGQGRKALVGREGAVLRQVAAGEDQVDPRLLRTHQLDHPAQAVCGIHTQQTAVRFGEQVAVGELHQQQRCGNGGGMGTVQSRLLSAMGPQMRNQHVGMRGQRGPLCGSHYRRTTE
ncbi:hypothetical protein D3C81_1692650 [compost metagenome]